MLLKIIGSIFLILGTGGFGYYKGMEYKKQIEEVERLKRVIWLLRGEIKYTRASLDEVCHRTAKKIEKPYDLWLSRIEKGIKKQEYEKLGILWKKETEKLIKQVHLPEDIEKECSILGYQLRNIDIEMQEQTLAWFEKKLEEKRQRLAERLEEKRKLCNCLGVMSGVLLVILIW